MTDNRAMRALLLFATFTLSLSAADAVDPFLEGERLYSQGKYTVALDYLAGATKQNPANADAWLYLGNIQTLQSNFVEADKAYQRALELRENSPDILASYGALKRQQKMYDVAEALFRKALVAKPAFAPAREQLGKLYFETFEWNKSADELEALLGLNPQHPQRTALENLIKKLRANLAMAEEKRKEFLNGGKPTEKPPVFSVDLKDAGKGAELKTKAEGSVDAKRSDPEVLE